MWAMLFFHVFWFAWYFVLGGFFGFLLFSLSCPGGDVGVGQALAWLLFSLAFFSSRLLVASWRLLGNVGCS